MKRERRTETTVAGWSGRTMILSFLAGLSKMAGLARDVLLASLLGLSGTADAVFLAFQLPNLFRRVFGDGVMNAVLVPVLARAADRGPGVRNALLSRWLACAGIAGIIGGLFLVWLPEIPARILARTQAVEVAALLQLMAGYLAFISIAVVFKAHFEQFRMFTLPALMPLLFNVVVIGCTWMWWRQGWLVSSGFAIGVTCGGLIQAAILSVVAWKMGWRPVSRVNGQLPRLPFVRRVVPMVAAAGMFQWNLVVSRQLASGLVPGSVAVLDYASRLLEVTLGVAAFPLATVLLPGLSGQAATGDRAGVGRVMTKSLSALLLVTVPASVGLVLLREPIVALLFQRGSFDAGAVQTTALVLGWFAAGLVAFGAVRLLFQEPFSRQSVRMPVMVTVTAFVVNGLSAVLLVPKMGVAGIAAAASLAALVAAIMLAVAVARACPLDWHRMGLVTFRVAVAATVMGMVVHGLKPVAAGLGVLGVIGIGVVSYGLVWWFMPGADTRRWVMALWRDER